MLLPFSTPLGFSFDIKPNEHLNEDQWLIFSDDKLLVNLGDKTIPNCRIEKPFLTTYLGYHNKRNLYAACIDTMDGIDSNWTFSNLRNIHNIISNDYLAIAGRALQLIAWYRNNSFCGRCGTKNFERDFERCLECPSCGLLIYPKLSPAIMVLIKCGKEILLARGPHFPAKQYSVLAGYIDPGETVEQCIEREVFEEVGLKVKNIQYFGSQPWPFSHSLMLAFSCDWHEGSIKIDSHELEDAAWFNINNLPDLPPHLSIARYLIDSVMGSSITSPAPHHTGN
jgi:NAD+ diphosphatase